MRNIIVRLILIFNVVFLFSQGQKIIQPAVQSLMISPDARPEALASAEIIKKGTAVVITLLS